MPPLTPQNFDDLLITSVAVRQDVRTAKVLIVDRDPEFVESLRRVVGEAGYPTVGAHTAIEALATVIAHSEADRVTIGHGHTPIPPDVVKKFAAAMVHDA